MAFAFVKPPFVTVSAHSKVGLLSAYEVEQCRLMSHNSDSSHRVGCVSARQVDCSEYAVGR